MKRRNCIAVVATGMILAAPALAAGSAGEGGAAVDLASSSLEAPPSAGTAPVRYESQQERSLGIACAPGPIMDMEDPFIADSAGSRAATGPLDDS